MHQTKKMKKKYKKVHTSFMQMSIKGKIIQTAEEKGGWGVSKKKLQVQRGFLL